MPDSYFNYYYSNEGILYRKTKRSLVDGNYVIDYDINYYLDNDKILAEFKETSEGIKKIQYFYDLNGISSILYNNKVYNLVKDSLGSISKVIRDGLILAEYDYDAWGNSTTNYIQNDLSDDDNYIIDNNPFRYRGYYYDVETSLFWLSSRYYSPELCRFISPDDVEYLDPSSINGLNLYAYCNNDPINYYDPSGHFAITATIGLSTAAYYAIIALLAVTAVATTAYVESETHIIQNSLTSLGNAIVDLGEYAVSNIKDLFYSEITSVSSQELKEEYYNIISNNADPYGRSGQKKQGRELKNKARERFTQQVKFRGGRKPPKKHTPGRGHRKYLYLLLWRYLRDEMEQWWNLD